MIQMCSALYRSSIVHRRRITMAITSLGGFCPASQRVVLIRGLCMIMISIESSNSFHKTTFLQNFCNFFYSDLRIWTYTCITCTPPVGRPPVLDMTDRDENDHGAIACSDVTFPRYQARWKQWQNLGKPVASSYSMPAHTHHWVFFSVTDLITTAYRVVIVWGGRPGLHELSVVFLVYIIRM